METPNGWSEEDFCMCGALLDALGLCPYCDYAADVTEEDKEYWSWFDLLDIDDELREE